MKIFKRGVLVLKKFIIKFFSEEALFCILAEARLEGVPEHKLKLIVRRLEELQMKTFLREMKDFRKKQRMNFL